MENLWESINHEEMTILLMQMNLNLRSGIIICRVEGFLLLYW